MVNSLIRKASVVGLSVTVGIAALVGPAAARDRRSEEVAGAAIAIGIGALVLSKILSSRGHDRDRDHRPEPRHEPRYERHSHPAPHVHRAPKREPHQNFGR